MKDCSFNLCQNYKGEETQFTRIVFPGHRKHRTSFLLSSLVSFLSDDGTIGSAIGIAKVKDPAEPAKLEVSIESKE